MDLYIYEPGNYSIMLASYADDTLIDYRIIYKEFSETGEYLEPVPEGFTEEGADTVKAFLWDENMTPLCPGAEKIISEE